MPTAVAEKVNNDTSRPETVAESEVRMISEPGNIDEESRAAVVSLAPKRRFRSVLPVTFLPGENTVNFPAPIKPISRRFPKMKRSGHLPIRWAPRPVAAESGGLICPL